MNEAALYIDLRPNLELPNPSVVGEMYTAHVEHDGKDLQIDTYGVDNRAYGSRRTMLVFSPWSDYFGREFMQRRVDAIAEASESVVVGVDNLGVGTNTSHMPAEVRKQIQHGDFSQVSELMWQAARQNPLVDLDNTDELILGYHSLGATMAAELTAHAPEGVSVDRLLLLEAVTLREQSFGALMLKYATRGADQIKQYFAENPEWVPKPSSPAALIRGIGRQAAGHYVYPQGMGRRPVFSALELARERETLTKDSLVHLTNGSRSELSTTAENDFVAERVRNKLGLTIVRTVLNGETHPMNDSLPRAIAYFEHELK